MSSRIRPPREQVGRRYIPLGNSAACSKSCGAKYCAETISIEQIAFQVNLEIKAVRQIELPSGGRVIASTSKKQNKHFAVWGSRFRKKLCDDFVAYRV
ncbi:MAG: hypothetical protein R3C52_14220 [Hyphomonadaceae bacterium]